MAPALLFFSLLDIKNGAWGNIAKRIIELSMLYNFDYPHLKVPPGVYWYFSLTFQYYLLYCFCRKWFKPLSMLLLSAISILLLYVLIRSDLSDIQYIYRTCFPGWFPLFALGIWFAGNDKLTKNIENLSMSTTLILLVILFVFVVVTNINIFSWLFLPIFSLFFFLLLSKIFLSIPYANNLLKWIGKLSACVFVCHPIAREFVRIIHDHLHYNDLYFSLFAYTILTFILAYFYQKLHKRLLSKYIK